MKRSCTRIMISNTNNNNKITPFMIKNNNWGCQWKGQKESEKICKTKHSS